MKLRRMGLGGLAVIALTLGGCAKPPAPSIHSTGAELVAKRFFQSLANDDWPAAYETLDSESRTWCSKDQFARLSQKYRSHMEFSPTEVSVIVTETENHASAVATYRGASGTELKSFKDGTALQRTSGSWFVQLRKNFGKKAAAAPPPKR